MILVELLENKSVMVDDRSALLGGSFWLNPHLMPYSPLPLKWAYERLIIYPKAVLLDVGASTGCFTLLSKHHPHLEVHAFEPVPLTARVLRENVYLNQLGDKVTVNECGVSNYNGEGILHSVKALGGSGVSMVDGKKAWHKDCDDLPVDVITIDAYCNEHNVIPSMLKIDTEGGEKFVLLGAEKTINKYHPHLIVEFSGENTDQYGYLPSELIVMLEAWGYVFTLPEGLDILAVHRDWDKKDKEQT